MRLKPSSDACGILRQSLEVFREEYHARFCGPTTIPSSIISDKDIDQVIKHAKQYLSPIPLEELTIVEARDKYQLVGVRQEGLEGIVRLVNGWRVGLIESGETETIATPLVSPPPSRSTTTILKFQRNVYVRDLSGAIVAGLYQSVAPNVGWTQSEFYDTLDIAFDVKNMPKWWLRDTAGRVLQREGTDKLRLGDYTVVTANGGAVKAPLSVPQRIQRTLNHNCNGKNARRPKKFSIDVRKRDERCVMSGGKWEGYIGLIATHIVPLNRPDSTSELIDKLGEDEAIGYTEAVNSPENGISLEATLHKLWNLDQCSIDSSNGHKMLFFTSAVERYQHLQGRPSPVLSQPYPDSEKECHRPLDLLLRWHYERCVLGYVRGAGKIYRTESELIVQGG